MKYQTLLGWALILIIAFLVAYLFFYTKSEGFKCVSNTPKYLVEGLQNSNNDNLTCTCFLQHKPTAVISLDSDGFHTIS